MAMERDRRWKRAEFVGQVGKAFRTGTWAAGAYELLSCFEAG
jgi:hypothetical protein